MLLCYIAQLYMLENREVRYNNPRFEKEINMTPSEKHSKIISFLWDLADLLWGAMAKSEHQNVVLPFTVLRRLDYTLQPTREKVLKMEYS